MSHSTNEYALRRVVRNCRWYPEYMNIFLAVGSVLLLLISGALYLYDRSASVPTPLPITEVQDATQGAPTFTWSYDSVERDSIPYTEISSTASYENGASVTKRVGTVEGSCNVYENNDADVYERSTMIICYYAGLGRYFKIVEEEEGYAVQRKVFEEASPDYTPPQETYETVVRF